MAGFNIKKWGDNLVNYALKRANKAISDTELKLLQMMRKTVEDCFNFSRSKAAWTNRTYNLVSSFYAVLFYNGKILGVETAGADFAESTTLKKAIKSDSKKKKIVVGTTATRLNPIFSYWFTGQGNRPWKNDPNEPKRTGRVFANQGVDYAKREVNPVGYSIVIGFAMPYARSPRGHLDLKVSGTLGIIIARLYDDILSMGLSANMRKLKGTEESFWDNDVS